MTKISNLDISQNQEIVTKDIETIEYPRLEINLKKVYENTMRVKELCDKKDISIAGIIKMSHSMKGIAETMIAAGCEYIGTSRLNQIKRLREEGINKPLMLIRLPMKSEAVNVIRYADISLNSEADTLFELNEEAVKQGKIHKVILMMDLGDLREGVFDVNEIIEMALWVEKKLSNLHLYGIGTNLGCYGAIVPTEVNIGKLCETAEQIEAVIGRELEVISGGATSSLTLLTDGKMPKKVNNLRIGEGILVARDLDEVWEYDIADLHKDAFILKAEVIEIKDKPSHPIGKIFIDAFCNTPTYEDRGIRRRALLGIGKQDLVNVDTLNPFDKDIKIIGGSSDHLIIDVEDCEKEYRVGDVIEFYLSYQHLLYLMNEEDVNKVFV
ncbi:MAG: alanine/ornithine racemase family PLP-dependent enzyme [Clostridium sp.]